MTLLHHWNRLSKLPGGKWLFSKIIGKRIPYSGSISPHVEILEPGHSRISMRDTQKVRNHLDCIHAVALINLAELTSGTAMVAREKKDKIPT
jgi:acyl-coenzyme A thioesterase PaaI-like protein